MPPPQMQALIRKAGNQLIRRRFTTIAELIAAIYASLVQYIEVAKPIPSYHVYKGTVFDLVDHAVDFVMSRINLWVGTRKDGPQAPIKLIPYLPNRSILLNTLNVWEPGLLI